VREDDRGRVVVTDEATGIRVESDNRPIALRTLAEKLEVERPPEERRSRR
jgi:hypothetical protein